MASRKDTSTEEELSIDVTGSMPLFKKHKKHKHKKHRRKKDPLKPEDLISDPELMSSVDIDMKPALKLKFKIGSQTLGEKSVAIIQDVGMEDENQLIDVVEDVLPSAVVKPESDISDEDAWLEALESGKLDEYDEMKRMKDPALMTARQRALLESKLQRDTQLQEYVVMPIDYKEKEMTEEMLQKKEMRAKKRRQQAQEKREKDKIQTIDRLLKKQDPKPKGSKSKTSKKAEVPKFTYINGRDAMTISIPVGFDFPLKKSGPDRPIPLPVYCGAAGCKNLKKYTCSRTGVPLCSLDCYRKNLASAVNTNKVAVCLN